MKTPSRTAVNKPAAILAGLAVSAIGAIFYNVLPMVVGVVQDARGLDDRAVGLLGSAFFVGFTGITLTAFFWIRRWSWRRVTAVTLPLACVALLATAAAESYAAMLAVMVLAGGAFSALYGVGTTLLGDTAMPARWYGTKIAAEAGLGAVLLLTLPYAVERWGFVGLAGGMVVAALALAPLLLGMPAAGRDDRVQTGTSPSAADRRASGGLAIWFALLAVFLFMTAVTAVWAFLERLGNDAAYPAAAVAKILSLTLLFAVLGSLTASAVGGRVGSRLPFAAACAAFVGGLAVVAAVPSFSGYAVGACLLTYGIGLGLPYGITIAAQLDPDGRHTVLTVPAIGLGNIIAPALGGFLADAVGYTGVLYAGGVLVLLALAAAMLALNAGGVAVGSPIADEDVTPLV